MEIKCHKRLIETIKNFKKPKTGILISRKKELNKVKARFKANKKDFEINFTHDFFASGKKNLKVGTYYKNIFIKFNNDIYKLENMFLGKHSPPKITGSVDWINKKGFSDKAKYYYKLVIPIDSEMKFHYNLEETVFCSDLGIRSRNGTTVKINEEEIQLFSVCYEKKDFYVIIESQIKQTFDEFSRKANSLQIGIGYLSGYYAGNQGFYFANTNSKCTEPKYFRCVSFRDSIKSDYSPVYSNSYGYIHKNDKKAKHYYKLLRPVSLIEFSSLCNKVFESQEFSSALVLILESSIASLLFMPGGYAIALETISDLIIGNKKLKLAPIKEKSISKKIRKEILRILDNYQSSILPEDLEILYKRVDQLNQTTNMARLKAPFDILEIELNEKDIEILKTRNDFLHGRVPDLTKAGKDRTIDRINKDLYYASIKFYTLLNMLILKWVGYDNRVVNLPKIQEGYTQIKLKEEPFRQV